MTLKSVRGDPLRWVSGFDSALNAARNRAWVLVCAGCEATGPRQEWPPRHRNFVRRVVCFEELANA
jgi:hypothetical protein